MPSLGKTGCDCLCLSVHICRWCLHPPISPQHVCVCMCVSRACDKHSSYHWHSKPATSVNHSTSELIMKHLTLMNDMPGTLNWASPLPIFQPLFIYQKEASFPTFPLQAASDIDIFVKFLIHDCPAQTH